MLERMSALIKKEFVQFFRDRFLVLLVLYMFIEVALCGWAITMDIRQLGLVVVDSDQSPASRAVVGALVDSGYFRVVDTVQRQEVAAQHLDSGRAQAALVIPPDFQRSWVLQRSPTAAQPGPRVQLLVDGTASILATQALAYADGILQSFAARQVLGSLTPVKTLPGIDNQMRITFAPSLNYTHFVMLTMVAIAVIFLGVILAAASVIREKENGTLDQLLVSPVRTGEVIGAKILTMTLVKFAGLGIGILISMWGFGVPLKGSALLFVALSALMFVSSMGLGIYVAAITRTMRQAVLLIFFILFPAMFLSGTIVPVENMPVILQALSLLSPLRYYTTIILGIFLKGVGLEVLWPETAALAVFAVALFWLSTRQIRRTFA